MKAYAPNGTPIRGTLERVYGTALAIVDSFTSDGGIVEFEYAGETDVHWDSQEAVIQDDERVFVDEAGNEWLESEIELREEDEDAEVYRP